jgi:hypothetical protein
VKTVEGREKRKREQILAPFVRRRQKFQKLAIAFNDMPVCVNETFYFRHVEFSIIETLVAVSPFKRLLFRQKTGFQLRQ